LTGSLASSQETYQENQYPRIQLTPRYLKTSGMAVVRLCAAAGLLLDPWQTLVLADALGVMANGRWAAIEVGLCIPRQNGKTFLIAARVLAGLFLFKEEVIIHSSHRGDTSMKAFRQIKGYIEKSPMMRQRLARNGIRSSHGQESITLNTGQRVEFRTRAQEGGRGFSADCVIFDEAMDLPDEMVAALMPTLIARPRGQVWYAGSAVDQRTMPHGVAFARIRERGLGIGDSSRLCYVEWSHDALLERIDAAVLDNRELWWRTNPSLGVRADEEMVALNRRAMPSRKFATECLCIGDWPVTDDDALRVIDLLKWDALIDDDSSIAGPVTLAFDVKPGGDRGSICAAGARPDGLAHVEIIETDQQPGRLVARLAEIAGRNRINAIICDPTASGSLVAEVQGKIGRELKLLSIREHGEALGMMLDGVSDATLRHRGDPRLRAAIDGATKKALGDSYRWDRKNSSVDISGLVAVSFALWGEVQRRNRPKSRVVSLADSLEV
jgi:terminase large subunit-like protein